MAQFIKFNKSLFCDVLVQELYEKEAQKVMRRYKKAGRDKACETDAEEQLGYAALSMNSMSRKLGYGSFVDSVVTEQEDVNKLGMIVFNTINEFVAESVLRREAEDAAAHKKRR